MSQLSSSSERIVIVGGGFAGLSVAALLAKSGMPVTVIESSKLGHAASTLNQGWLHSGAWFAKTHPELAQSCYKSLRQTVKFCPECIEPDLGTMIYYSLSDQSSEQDWTQAWDEVGIPHQNVLDGELHWKLPQIDRDKIAWARRLPDLSFLPNVLLSKLATMAHDAGAEIRPGTYVTGLLIEDQQVYGVRVGADEEIRAKMVILAIGAYSSEAFSPLFQEIAGSQPDYQLVCLKTHLSSIRPGLSADPFCLVDGCGFNHLPHKETSVFGAGRWEVVANASDTHVDPEEIEIIERQLEQIFPNGFSENLERHDWSGTTVQAMHMGQIEPGAAPLPTIVDHSIEPCGIENVLSIFPGRATLWPHLAERVRNTVLEKAGSSTMETAQPPWALEPQTT